MTELHEVSLPNYLQLCDLLGCHPYESIQQAAERIERGQSRASHRARRAARKVLQLDGWPAINQAVGYRRPTPARLTLVG
jgi:hypothetical protein